MRNARTLVDIIAVLCLAGCLSAVELRAEAPQPERISLPPARQAGGMPLMQALQERRTQRDFSLRPLPDPLLGDLLWAAWGVNRPETGKRTAPSGNNLQAIDLYVALESGLYLYNAQDHALEKIGDNDIRETVGRQDFTQIAPVGLVYVADFNRLRGDESRKTFNAATDVGFIAQNVYLFCASESLATVVLGWIDRDALAARMGLQENQRILLSHVVGYPAEP